jgi:dolichyl-phosphate-mannose--protein O-mannosyl transferase
MLGTVLDYEPQVYTLDSLISVIQFGHFFLRFFCVYTIEKCLFICKYLLTNEADVINNSRIASD